ncbi:uncharacterized protein LOC135689158 isoform X2 [Rhopilema esculentum]|uniref:uncharacterized protein LOC135689158 isoform X2 n=1 Tax=Rhopilema esculentum TaxID=499914 RepID=UPI0031DDC428
MNESISNNEQNVPINEAFVPETQSYDDIDGQTQVYALEDQPTILYENSSNIKTPRSKRPVEQSSFEDDDNATQAYGLLCEGAPSIKESQSDTDEADKCATQAYGLLDQQTIPYSLEADTDETDELATQAYGVLTKASLDKDDDDDTGDFCATQAYGLSDENKPGLDAKREETETDDIETQAYGILGNIELDEKFLTKSDSEETDELATQAYGILTKASLDKDDDDDTAADDFETQAYGVSDAANVADEKYLEKSDNEETDEDLDQATQAYGLCSNDLPKRGTNDDMLPPRRSLSGRAAKTRRTVTWSQGRPMENEGDSAENDGEEKQENAGEDETLELKVKAKQAGRPKLGAAVSNSGQDKVSLKKGRPRRDTKSMTAEADDDTNVGRRSLARKVQLSNDEVVKAKAEETMTVKKKQRAKRTISEQISQEDEAISTGGGQPNTDDIERNQNDDFVDKEEPVNYGDTEKYSKLKRSRRVSKTARQRGNSQRGRRKTVDHEISDDEESGNLSERKKIGVVTDSSAKKENLVEEEEEADTFDEETDSLGANEQSVEKKDKKGHLEAQQFKSRRGRKRGSSRKCIMEREHEIKNAGLEMTFAKDDATAVDTDVSVTAQEIDENRCLDVPKSRGKKRGISSQPVNEKGKEDDRTEKDRTGTTIDEGNSTVKVIDVSAMASGIEESKFLEAPVSVSRRGRKRRTLSHNVKESENEDDEIRDNRLEDIKAQNDSVVNDIDITVMASDKVENERHKAQVSTSRRGRNRRPLSMNVHEHGDNGTANDESNKTDINLDSSTADNDISLGATEREGNRRRGARKSVSGRGRKRGTSKKSVIEQESIMMEDHGIETTSNEQNIAADDIDAPLVAVEGTARRHDVITKKPRENGDNSLLEHSATSVDTSLSGDQPGKNRRRTNVKGKGHATKCNVNEEEDKDQDAKEEVPRIMFTGLTDKNIEKSALVLGAQLADSVYEATHLVTDKVRRTVKFLCCLSRGIPIVGPQWLAVCKQNNSFGDAGEYTVKDKSTEKQYDFSLQRSLQLAKERKLLDEYSVYVTKNVKPDPKQMKDIIQCCGGQALHRLPKHVDDKTLIISCEEDKTEVKNAAKSGYQINTAEFLLTGILRQKLEPDLFKLDVESESEKRGNKRNHSRSELETSKNTPKRRKR